MSNIQELKQGVENTKKPPQELSKMGFRARLTEDQARQKRKATEKEAFDLRTRLEQALQEKQKQTKNASRRAEQDTELVGQGV